MQSLIIFLVSCLTVLCFFVALYIARVNRGYRAQEALQRQQAARAAAEARDASSAQQGPRG